MNNYVLAVDLGATKAAIAIVSEEFEIHEKVEVSTGKETSEKIWYSIEQTVQKLLANQKGNLLGVGIGSAGPINSNLGEISPVNIPSWRNFPIIQKFKSITNSSEVRLHGDAIAFAHAEYKLGAGQNSNNMLGLVVSTGIGGGLILNQKLFLGESGNSGYFGHHTISFEGKKCDCGRVGCVETYASGPMMVEYAKSIGWNNQHWDFKSLAEDARNGNSFAISSIDRGTKALASAIVNVLDILDIKTVVIGGGVSEAGDIFWKPLNTHVQKEATFAGFLGEIQLKPAKLLRDAGIFGAALAILDSERY